jgi:hypothetical protein
METKLTSQGKTYNVIGDGDRENVTIAPAPMIRFELTFKGTPYRFWLFVKDNLAPDLFYTDRLQPQRDDDHAHVYFRSLSDEKTARYLGWTGAIFLNQVGHVKAETTPDKKAKLTVNAVEEYWPELSKTWEILHTALDREGWIEAAGAAPDALALPPSGAGGGQGTLMRKVLVRLHKQIEDSFGDEELRTLCFDIGEDYESLPAQGKAGKARELVACLDRRGRIPDLIAKCSELRPNVSWEDKPE